MAPFDLVSLGVGLAVGVLATVFVRELAFRKVQNQEHSKLTSHWSLAERGGKPVRLCAETLGEVEVPPGSQVLLAKGGSVPALVAERCEVRFAPQVRSNFAMSEGRALVFASAPRPGTLAIWTYEDQVLQRLGLEWEHAWHASEPAVPRARVSALGSVVGATVEVVGSVSDVAEKGGMHYLRLIDHGITATVASATPMRAEKGHKVRVLGTVEKPPGAREPVLRALKVEALPG